MARQIEGDDAPARGYAWAVLDMAPDLGAGRVAMQEKEGREAGIWVGRGGAYANEAVGGGEGEAAVWHGGGVWTSVGSWGLWFGQRSCWIICASLSFGVGFESL